MSILGELSTLASWSYHIGCAAFQARSNRSDCRVLGTHLLTLQGILEEEEAQGALAVTTRAVASKSTGRSRYRSEDLRGALAQAQALVKKCELRKAPVALLLSSVTAAEFQSVSHRLALCLQQLVVASTQGQNMQLQKLAEALGNSRFEACQAIKDLHATVEVGFNKSHNELATVTQQQTEEIKAAILAAAGGAPSAALIAGLQEELQEQRANKENLEIYYLQLVIDVLSAESLGAGSSTGCAPADLPADPSPPAELCCPIGHEMMEDLVMLVKTSETYDRKNIEGWFARGHRTCPVSGHRILRDLTLVPNRSIYRLVEGWKDYKGPQLIGAGLRTNRLLDSCKHDQGRRPPSTLQQGGGTAADAAAQAQRARDGEAQAQRARDAAAQAQRARDAEAQALLARGARAEAEAARNRERPAEAAVIAKREREEQARTEAVKQEHAEMQVEHARTQAAGKASQQAEPEAAGDKPGGMAVLAVNSRSLGRRLFGKQKPKVEVPATPRRSNVIPYSQYRSVESATIRKQLGLDGQGCLPGYAYKTGCHGLGYYIDAQLATGQAQLGRAQTDIDGVE
ncbi:hypothetical protein WJX72_002545 [[Myrmecia] bisecta]|uniref:U-box domain-containing protein n=1 Tax=[Myrmecia] bisecta TaxID=41462 RepID=A0AAW1P4S9_9CHLO